MKKTFLSIVIPAFNEEFRIKKTLLDLKDYLNKQKYSFEVIVVSDGSTDKTVNIVKEISNNFQELKIIEETNNHGKGFVTKKGVLSAKGEWVLFMDADNSTKIIEIEKFWEYTDSSDIIFASRSKPGKNIKRIQPLMRKFVSKFSNLLIRFELKTNLTDTQCGFKLFSRKAVEVIFPKLTIDRFGFDMEILAIARIHNLRITEVGVNWTNIEGSKVRAIRDLKRSLLDLAIIKDNINKKIY